MAVALVGIVLEVVLVIVFGHKEFRGWADFRDNRPGPQASLVQLLLAFFGQFFLLVVVIEDDRAVLRSHVGALPVQRRWIVRFPEHFQQVVERDLAGIELDLADFRVPCVALAHLFVGRVVDFAPGVSRLDGDHAVNLLKHGLDAPEAAGAEGGQLQRLTFPATIG